MRYSRLALSAALLGLTVLPSLISSADDDNRGHHRERRFDARLSGDNEVPPISSAASGRLHLVLNDDETELTFTLSWRDLTADATVAHIHFGPTKVNGGVMVFFCGGGGQAACPAGDATITGTIAAANVVGPAGQGIAPGEFAEVIEALRSDLSYANVHNATFPGGEIRGAVN